MTAAVPPPTVDVQEGWRLVSEEVTTPFDVRFVRVIANTRIYEDVDLRERLATETGTETTWRFVFASRLRISPIKSSSRALTKLVEERANASFVEVIGDRGFEAVQRADTHRLTVGGSSAESGREADRSGGENTTVEATRYRARVRLDDRTVPVEAYFATWPGDGGTYLLGGGAYPLSLPESIHFDPERARDELFSILGSIR